MDTMPITTKTCPFCKSQVLHTYCQKCYARKIRPGETWIGLSDFEQLHQWVAYYTEAKLDWIINAKVKENK